MSKLDDKSLRLLGEGKNFGVLATLMSDGSPQTSVVWVDTDGEHAVFNTAEGRLKPQNIRRDDRVSLCVINAENPYEQSTIRGRVVEITTEGGDAHIDKLAFKYLGQETYPFRAPGEVRLICRIAPEKVG